MNRRHLAWPALSVVLALSGCAGNGGSAPETTSAGAATSAPVPSSSDGRYAMSGDAYPEAPPDVSQVSDAVPRVEAPSRAGNRSTYEVWGKTYQVLDDARGYQKRGTASWYGQKFHGYATSNGEIYDMYKMSAAHKSLPLPTYARVTNLDNGREVIVRVNDRGPFHDDREIDLSYAAAARLDILDGGTGRVEVSAIDPQQWLARHSGAGDAAPQAAASVARTAPPVSETAPRASPTEVRAPAAQPAASAAGDRVYIQVAALGSADSAAALKSTLESRLDESVRVASAAGLHKVQIGPFAGRSQAESVRQTLRQVGYPQTFVVDGR